MRAAEGRARGHGWALVISDTTDNVASANNFITAGYRLYRPRYPWGATHFNIGGSSLDTIAAIELASLAASSARSLLGT
jgi:hypothetical protein